MARVFISGSADGLGFMAGRRLMEQGHQVIFHARSATRAEHIRRQLPNAENITVGDVSTLKAMRDVAEQVNALGACDAVIHNVAIGYQEPRRVETADKLPQLFAINTLAPYVLTALIRKPKRLIYMSSGLHLSAGTDLTDALWTRRRWDGLAAYSESKFHNALQAFALARLWPDVHSNALEPGWVPTKMGGASAPDDLELGCETQAWLAVSNDNEAKVTGEYFFHKRQKTPNPAARDLAKQDQLLEICAELSGIKLK